MNDMKDPDLLELYVQSVKIETPEATAKRIMEDNERIHELKTKLRDAEKEIAKLKGEAICESEEMSYDFDHDVEIKHRLDGKFFARGSHVIRDESGWIVAELIFNGGACDTKTDALQELSLSLNANTEKAINQLRNEIEKTREVTNG